eukprot:1987481-Pleurochrysis_carterae.AAC.1
MAVSDQQEAVHSSCVVDGRYKVNFAFTPRLEVGRKRNRDGVTATQQQGKRRQPCRFGVCDAASRLLVRLAHAHQPLLQRLALSPHLHQEKPEANVRDP